MVGDQQEQAGCCISVASYRQSLCIETEITKPEIEITKDAPERATLCEVIPFTYTITNSGTADITAFTVEDALPDGLETESGDSELRFEVEGLPAGDTRKFEAQIRARKRGEFSSRAVAKAEDGPQHQSKKVTTKVEGPELAVAIDGPEAAYMDRPIDYTVRITNHGDQAVDQGRLELIFPTAAQLSRQREFSSSDEKVEQNESDSANEPQEAAQQESDRENQSRQADQNRQRNSQQNKNRRTFEFSGLQPGETIKTKFSLQGLEEEQITVSAKASHECRTAEGTETLTSSVANVETEVITLSALLVSVVDEQDPIQVGDEVVYKIVVRNQGTAPDQNVEITAQLPEGLTYEEANGASSAESDGQEVKFETVDEIQPGETLEWTLRATAESQGDAVLKVSVKSDGLGEAVESQEPTQVFDPESESE